MAKLQNLTQRFADFCYYILNMVVEYADDEEAEEVDLVHRDVHH